MEEADNIQPQTSSWEPQQEAPQAQPEAAPEERRRGARRALSLGRNAAMDLVHGRLFSLDFFRHHWMLVGGIVAMLIIYTANRYHCQTLMEEIQRLETQLEVVRTERVRLKSTYMSRIRESAMQQRVDSLRLGLRVADQPPYVVKNHR